jgi:hypothetical protein
MLCSGCLPEHRNHPWLSWEEAHHDLIKKRKAAYIGVIHDMRVERDGIVNLQRERLKVLEKLLDDSERFQSSLQRFLNDFSPYNYSVRTEMFHIDQFLAAWKNLEALEEMINKCDDLDELDGYIDQHHDILFGKLMTLPVRANDAPQVSKEMIDMMNKFLPTT